MYKLITAYILLLILPRSNSEIRIDCFAIQHKSSTTPHDRVVKEAQTQSSKQSRG
jgi:hypothetical protein